MAKRTKSAPSPANTPTLHRFFSPVQTSGAKYDRPNSVAGAPASAATPEPAARKENQAADDDDDVPITQVKKSKRIIVSDDEDDNDNDVVQIDELPSPRPLKKRTPLSDETLSTPSHKRVRGLDDFRTPSKPAQDLLSSVKASPALASLDSMTFSTLSSSASASRKVDFADNGRKSSVPRAAKSAVDTDSRPSWQVNPRDKKGRTRDDPNYDPTTIMVPTAALDKMSPGQRQYWTIKSTNYDTVLFFKIGKFYELYDDDALVGVKELGLLLMKGDRPHAGFPERCFDRHAETLVNRGFKIGRVEQMETPNELKERNQSTGSKSKVVNRELCSVLTKGTLVDSNMIGHPNTSYLLAVCESKGSVEYGICLCDTSTAQFQIGSFNDDSQRTRLRTLLASAAPVEVLYPAQGLSSVTSSILKKDLPHDVIRNPLRNAAELTDSVTASEKIQEYFPSGKLPDIVSSSGDLALLALGATVFYLKRCLLDQEIVPIGTFVHYDPNDMDPRFMALDGQTLTNLEIVQNSEGGTQGSLLEFVNHCVSPFGSRRIREWIIRPLARPKDITCRLDAVDDLIRETSARDGFRAALRKLPDLGRMLSRIHAYSFGRDSKAVMYENVGAAKLKVFLGVLDGLREASSLIPKFLDESTSIVSPLLKSLLTTGDGFPDMTEKLRYFENAFDIAAARRDGFIVPAEGVDSDYDDAEREIRNAEERLQAILKETRKDLRDSSIKFVDKNRERYQLEISESTISRLGGLSDDYEQVSQRKGFIRYYTADIKDAVFQFDRATEKRTSALSGVMRRLFAQFCGDFALWTSAVSVLAELDCLCSLALTSEAAPDGGVMCRPEFVDPVEEGAAVLSLRRARHPSLTMSSNATFIPNDTIVGCEENPAAFVLVTGPNMGGKSTLLRQTCLCVILSHLGCYVPAESCLLTPVDRIFTRVGACDRILAGQSTFYVELEETATILRHATRRSLVILDELGRGTSTFDGTAIAYAVARHLSHEIRCRTLFATHYHVLSEEFAEDEAVSAYYMASQLDTTTNTVTFLYKFVPGVCPGSFGINVAKMAGLPDDVVSLAEAMAKQFEDAVTSAHGKSVAMQLRRCLKQSDVEGIRSLIKGLRV
ncbi:DNA mismatch repair protein [Plasmodiophora brassicae]